MHGNYLTETRGLRSWLFTLDHKRIGVMYFWSTLAAFFAGRRLRDADPAGAADPEADHHDRRDLQQDLHAARRDHDLPVHHPVIPAAFGNFVLPLMLGAKDVAFPRLNLASYYIYVAGALIMLTAMVTGGIDTGWTFYTPYSSTTGGSVSHDDPGRVHPGLLLDLHRHQLHRHHPQAARARA